MSEKRLKPCHHHPRPIEFVFLGAEKEEKLIKIKSIIDKGREKSKGLKR
jgi:hypothetical protein